MVALDLPRLVGADLMSLLNAGLFILRVVVGLLFIGHGTQKLFGWFGGHGIGGTAGFFGSVGIQPARPLAVVSGLLETLGGVGLTLGLVTPVAAAFVAASMLGAITFVHWPKGLWISNGGYEYNLVLLAVSALFGLAGPGAYALDPQIGLAQPYPEAYLAGLVIAAVLVAILRLATGGVAAQAGRTASSTR